MMLVMVIDATWSMVLCWSCR